MRKIIFMSTLGVLLAIPALAIAGHRHHGGDGFSCSNASVCQYVENVPGGGGPHPTSPGDGGGGGGHSAISPATQHALASQGADGAGTATLANATAPRRFGHGGSGHNGSGGNGGKNANGGNKANARDQGNGGSAAGETGGGPELGEAVGHVVGDGDGGSGMGLALPIILGISLLAAIAMAIVLRRRRLAHAS